MNAIEKVHMAPDVMTLGRVFAQSGYFQDARDASQGIVKILAGQELGFGPVASMTGIYIVKGKVSLSANLIAASVKRGKYNYRVTELSDAACKITFFEGKEAIGESSFTMEDARAAGLAGEANYKKFPRNMLFARAMSNGAKWYCADVFGGPVYTPDELGAVVDGETGEMTARPPDEKILPPAPAALPCGHSDRSLCGPQCFEDKAADLFKTPEEEVAELAAEKATRLGRISAGMDMLKLSAGERTAAWAKFCDTYAFMTDAPDLYQLDGLLEELRRRHAAGKARERKA